MILNIIIAIIMIGLIVLIHEFGHFIVAKANGVAVVEFSIGFGPKLFGIKKGDTEYCLKLIPFGGSCIMLGDVMLTQSDDGSEDENGEDEDSDDLPAKERREELLKNYDADKAFAAKTVWSRIAIIAAGPVFNFLLAFVFAVIIIGSVANSNTKSVYTQFSVLGCNCCRIFLTITLICYIHCIRCMICLIKCIFL